MYIIDTMAQAYRLHTGFGGAGRLADSSGRDTVVLHGFLRILTSCLKHAPPPTHMAVVVDAPGATFRWGELWELWELCVWGGGEGRGGLVVCFVFWWGWGQTSDVPHMSFPTTQPHMFKSNTIIKTQTHNQNQKQNKPRDVRRVQGAAPAAAARPHRRRRPRAGHREWQ